MKHPRRVLSLLATAGVAIAIAAAGVLLLVGRAMAAEAPATGAAVPPEVLKWGLVSAAAAVAASAAAAGYAVARVGSAGIGAITEKPELVGRVLILVGLAEGIAIYGLIIAILILNRVG
ncbi:MAG: ATP synthase subunit C [Steroidobacteraceae bacterium]